MNTDPNVAELWQAQEENEKLRSQVAALAGLLRRYAARMTAVNGDIGPAFIAELRLDIDAALAAAGEGKA